MASQGQIRSFEQEQERRAAPPPPPALGPAPAPTTIPLGAKLPSIITSTPDMDQAVAGIKSEQERLRTYLPGLQAGVDARNEALQGELDRPLPGQPKLQDIPQFQPRQIDPQELQLFAGVAMALAGLGTKALRGDTTMALNAAAGALKGFNEGNLQQARLDLENFKRTMDSVVAQNHKMSDEYRNIIESRKMSLQQKQQALSVAAAARDDQVMLSALSSGQFKMIFDLESHRINATNQASIQSAQIYNTALWHAESLQQRREAAAQAAALAAAKPDSEPLTQVQLPDGRVVYAPRSLAVGATVPPPRTGDKLTEGEAKATLYWRQMSSAEDAAKKLVGEKFDVSKIGSQIDVRMASSDMTNLAASEEAQRYAQAAEQWAEAYLRLKTGAATTRDEIKRNARSYFPQPGDGPGTIAQKNAMRASAIQDVSIVAGRGADRAPPGSTPPPAAGAGPKEGERSTSKSGKAIVFRGGRWEYL